MDWKEYFKRGTYVVVATASKDGTPNACEAESQGPFGDDKFLLADCQMTTTIKNLMENPKICVVGDEYHRLTGTVELFSSGEYVETIKKRDPTIASGEYQIRHAIVVTIHDVYSLDEHKVIFQP